MTQHMHSPAEQRLRKTTADRQPHHHARRLATVTVTGADACTDITQLLRLVESHPSLEIGLLYTATPEQRNRYPTLEWLHKAADALASRCAIHICGSGARQQLRDGTLSDLVGKAWRVQVNGLVQPDEVPVLAKRVPLLITQHNEKNAQLAAGKFAVNHQLLVDGSGGTGTSPGQWTRPATTKRVGFAGGLGPDNIVAELPKIHAVAKGRYWIDLEGKLRTDDWFDLALCESFLMELGKALHKIGQHV
jgi:phosphoribosylanthranilate isomerase